MGSACTLPLHVHAFTITDTVDVIVSFTSYVPQIIGVGKAPVYMWAQFRAQVRMLT